MINVSFPERKTRTVFNKKNKKCFFRKNVVIVLITVIEVVKYYSNGGSMLGIVCQYMHPVLYSETITYVKNYRCLESGI